MGHFVRLCNKAAELGMQGLNDHTVPPSRVGYPRNIDPPLRGNIISTRR